jgi:RHS repeat-associated protein
VWSNVSGGSSGTCTSLPFGDAQNCTGTMPVPMHYTGQPLDSETNLNHFLYRQLSTTEGRWTTPDPAGMAAVDPTNPQTWNRYAYVMNSPLSYIDPLGLDGCSATFCVSVSTCPSGMTFQNGQCVAGQCQGAQGNIKVNGITICGPSVYLIYIDNAMQEFQQCSNGGCRGGYSSGSGGNAGTPITPPNQCTSAMCHVPNYKKPLSCDVDPCTPAQKKQWCADARATVDRELEITGQTGVGPLVTLGLTNVALYFEKVGTPLIVMANVAGGPLYTELYVNGVCKGD